MDSMSLLRKCVTLAIFLALIVLSLGAYTRLTDAGLGCPDWPGCYGRLHLPQAGYERELAQAHYPEQPIEAQKAWTEMIHRYVAGGLVILVWTSLMLSVRLRLKKKGLPLFLCAWILFQALLGMWTVTWRLLPLVVTAHLLSGAILFCGLCVFRCQIALIHPPGLSKMRPWFGLGILLVFAQMALGGWVSSNYAGLACLGFPTCNGAWFPLHGLQQGLQVGLPIGINYQGGWLQSESRAAIQVLHRLGAGVVLVYGLGLVTWLLYTVKAVSWRRLAWMCLAVLCLQITLGVLNVLYFLPLSIAVMHNLGAMLLLALFTMMGYWSKKNG